MNFRNAQPHYRMLCGCGPVTLLLGHIAVLRTQMRPIVTDRVARSVTLVSPAKTAAPIEMPFGMLSRVDPRNHVLDGGTLDGMGNFEG